MAQGSTQKVSCKQVVRNLNLNHVCLTHCESTVDKAKKRLDGLCDVFFSYVLCAHKDMMNLNPNSWQDNFFWGP